MLNWIKTHKLATAGIAIVLIYVIVSAIKGQWNPMNWFSSMPKAGDSCKDSDGKVGTLDASLNCIPNLRTSAIARAKWCKTPGGNWVTCFDQK